MALSGKTIWELPQISTGTTSSGLRPETSFFAVYQTGTTEQGSFKCSYKDIFNSQIFFPPKNFGPNLQTDGLEYVDASNAPTSYESVISSWGAIFKAWVNGGSSATNFTGNTQGEQGQFTYGMQRTIYASSQTVTGRTLGSDMFSGSTNAFGVNNFSPQFFSNSTGYKNKTIKLTVFGSFSGTGSFDYKIFCGNTELLYSYPGGVSITSPTNAWKLEMEYSITSGLLKTYGNLYTYGAGSSTEIMFPNSTQDVSAINGGPLYMYLQNDNTVNVFCEGVKIELLN